MLNFDVRVDGQWARVRFEGFQEGRTKTRYIFFVLNFLEDLENRGHIVAMNNFFTSVELPMKMESKGIHETDTMGPNTIGLPKVMTSTKLFGKNAPTCSMSLKVWFTTPLECTLIVHVVNH